MKARQPEFRAIPQFDSGRWKLRLERVPVHPDNETTMGVDFDLAAQARDQRDQWGRLVPVTDRARQTRTISILSTESQTPTTSKQAQQIEAGTRSVTELSNDHA